MRLIRAVQFSLAVVVIWPISTTAAISSEANEPLPRSVTLHAWPISETKPQELAQISYNPTSSYAAIESYVSPNFPSSPGSDIVRVGFFRKDTGSWSGVATSALSFAEDVHKKFTIHVDTKGHVYHVGFAAWRTPQGAAAKGGSGNGSVVAVVEKPIAGPQPHLNKPVVLNRDGKVDDKEPEKSFIQKYWWAIILVLLIQVAMGGAKE